MTLALFLDHNVPEAIAEGLRIKGLDVVTAYEDGSHLLDDPGLLDRSADLDRVLFTMDHDFLREATRRQRAGEDFAGIVYAHQQRCSIGRCIEDLDLLARAVDPEELRGRVEHLPL